MEHLKTGLLLSISLLVLVGCKKAIEQPESVDPIYQTFMSEVSTITAGIAAEKQTLIDSQKDLEKTDLSAGDRRQLEKQVSSSDKKIRLMEQDKRFFEIRAQSRSNYDRETYPKRFEKGLPWPDPDEVAEFEANRRLNAAPRSWDAHIPKLEEGPKPPTAGKIEKPAAQPKTETETE